MTKSQSIVIWIIINLLTTVQINDLLLQVTELASMDNISFEINKQNGEYGNYKVKNLIMQNYYLVVWKVRTEI